jgi:hypothetical protein
MQRLQAAECTSGPLGPFRGYPGCHHPLRRTLGGRLASTLCLGTAATRGCWAVLYNGTRYTCIHNTLARPLPFPPAPQNSQSPMLDGQRPGRHALDHAPHARRRPIMPPQHTGPLSLHPTSPPTANASMSLHPTGNLNERVPGNPQHTCTTSSGN